MISRVMSRSRPSRISLLGIASACLAIACFLGGTSEGLALGGRYTVTGGTPDEQRTVHDALAASSFNFDQIPQSIAINIVPSLSGENGEALPGRVTLSAEALDWRRAAWGTVQHEFAHEVDYLLLNDTQRAQALSLLDASAWYDPKLTHDDQGRERFATMLAWTFWPDRANNQSSAYHHVGQKHAREFQALLASWGLASPPPKVCRRVVVKRGHYDSKHRWVRPVLKTVCTSK